LLLYGVPRFIMAVILGSFLAKLISIGGLIGVVTGWQRNQQIAAAGFLVGSAIELFIHSSFFRPSDIGYVMAPVAVAAAIGIGWAMSRRKTAEPASRARAEPQPSAGSSND